MTSFLKSLIVIGFIAVFKKKPLSGEFEVGARLSLSGLLLFCMVGITWLYIFAVVFMSVWLNRS
jgi:biotin transporter BioY